MQEWLDFRCWTVTDYIREMTEYARNLRPEIAIDYLVNGAPRRAKTYDISGRPSRDRKSQRAVLDEFEVGAQYRCWYDPLDPEVVVLVRGYCSADLPQCQAR